MTLARLVMRSLVYHRRTGLVAAFGLAIATAVVTGSLVIGDSVSGSLRDTALSRLGRITHALVSPRYVRAGLAQDISSDCVALLAADGAAHQPQTDVVIPRVAVYGFKQDFWEQFRVVGPMTVKSLSERGCILNKALARDLGVSEGDSILVTLENRPEIALDTLFARREIGDTAPTVRLTVEQVLDGGPADFRLDSQNATPRNVFVDRDWLAKRLGRAGEANVILASADPQDEYATGALEDQLGKSARLSDHGLTLTSTAGGYLSLESKGTLLSRTQAAFTETAAKATGGQARATSVYLASEITAPGRPGARSIAYCVVCGIDAPLAPVSEDFPGPGEVWLNDWAANDMGVSVGDDLRIAYMVPTESGEYPERELSLRLTRIVPLAGEFADPALVPTFEGITDAATIDAWDPPFPVDLSKITQRDEDYWDKHRATPKAFVNMSAAGEMWQGGPQGKESDWITSVRIYPPDGADTAAYQRSLATALRHVLTPDVSGLSFRPLREMALRGSQGTSDFGQLFLGLSMFLVFAGAALAAMLLKLSAEQRSAESGILGACGVPVKTARVGLIAEGIVLTVLGVATGVPAGAWYAGALIQGLSNWWSGALGATETVWLHLVPGSLIAGGLTGLVVGIGTAIWSTRRPKGRTDLQLLAGAQGIAVTGTGRSSRRPAVALAACLVCAAGLFLAPSLNEGMSAEGAFFGIGFALLGATVAGASMVLSRALGGRSRARTLPRLALRNAAANAARSLLMLGLLAAATFILVAVGANARDFSRIDVTRRDSGTGGFALLARSSVPLPFDPATPEGRRNLGFTDEDEAALEGTRIYSLPAGPGEDISCLNISRPTHPRLLGVPRELAERGGFGANPAPGSGTENPWLSLWDPADDATAVALGDVDSIRWTLHSAPGKVYAMPGPGGDDVRLLLGPTVQGSIFQGVLLVSEPALRRIYPQVSGPSWFLVEAPESDVDRVAEALRRGLGDLGVEVKPTHEVLNEFTQVQNAYLSMFLALGGLGLLLGTVGIAAVLLRSALERRGELALLMATGFTRSRLAWLLLVENGSLLVAGLISGTLCALVAVAPRLLSVDAAVNWVAIVGLLILVLAVGATTSVVTAVQTVRGPLLAALRAE